MCSLRVAPRCLASTLVKYAHLKFTVYGRKQASIHTHVRNTVTLVWGSLRLAPIKRHVQVGARRRCQAFLV